MLIYFLNLQQKKNKLKKIFILKIMAASPEEPFDYKEVCEVKGSEFKIMRIVPRINKPSTQTNTAYNRRKFRVKDMYDDHSTNETSITTW